MEASVRLYIRDVLGKFVLLLQIQGVSPKDSSLAQRIQRVTNGWRDAHQTPKVLLGRKLG